MIKTQEEHSHLVRPPPPAHPRRFCQHLPHTNTHIYNTHSHSYRSAAREILIFLYLYFVANQNTVSAGVREWAFRFSNVIQPVIIIEHCSGRYMFALTVVSFPRRARHCALFSPVHWCFSVSFFFIIIYLVVMRNVGRLEAPKKWLRDLSLFVFPH